MLAWHFPNLVNYWGPVRDTAGPDGVVRPALTNWFATQWPDAWAVARETLGRLDELTARTRAFRDALFDSTLPAEVLDAVSSQMSIIRTTTCLRTEDGRFHAFEGCDDNGGLLPDELHARVELRAGAGVPVPPARAHDAADDYQFNTLPDGEQKFRTHAAARARASPGTTWRRPTARWAPS